MLDNERDRRIVYVIVILAIIILTLHSEPF